MGQHQESVERQHPATRGINVSHPYPLGSTVTPEGTNFSVFSANATGMEIVLFDHADDLQPARVIALDPVLDRTSHYWHIFVPNIKAGQLYGYRADGPYDPPAGHRFDRYKVLIDPYGKSISVSQHYSRATASKPGDNSATAMKSVTADLCAFDWEGDVTIKRPFRRTVIYEMHVAGFTRHPDSGVAPAKRGTYLGVIDKIPYLQELWITAVELMPVFQFDAQDAVPGSVTTGDIAPFPSSLPISPIAAARNPWDAWTNFGPW